MVHSPSAGEVHEVAAILAAAFQTDPVFSWFWPNADRRQRRLPPFFHAVTERQYLPHGHVYLSEGAAAVWAPPGRHRVALFDQLRLAPALAPVLGVAALRVLRSLAVVEKVHPAAPHYYLFAVGTRPDLQGRGLGAEVLRPVLERCDHERVLAHLENSNPRNTPFYRRLGFEEGETLALPGGPPVQIMTRQPRGL